MNYNNTALINLSVLLTPLFLLWTMSSYGQTVNEPNVTIFIYQDDNNNGAKELEEVYLGGFSVEVTGFNGESIEFKETSDGVFQGYLERRARVVINDYNDDQLEGNVGEKSSASVFFADPKGGKVSYYVAISTGPVLDYTRQNIILPCYEGGPSDGKPGPALITLGYMHEGIAQAYGGEAPNPSMLASTGEVGAVWGVGLRTKANIVFASALVKRHVGLGPQGIAGLYQYDLNTDLLTSYNLQGVSSQNNGQLNFGTLQRKNINGPIAHDGSDDYTLTFQDQIATYDLDAFDKVAKEGIGDIDVTEDEKTLWLVNLHNRSLVAVDVSTGAPNLNTVQEYPILEKVKFIDLEMPYVRNINVGSQEPGGAEAFTDHNKIAWEKDIFGKGGEYGITNNTISNAMNADMGTTESNLYRSYRIGNKFSYSIPVPASGDYKVILHFAETDPDFMPSEGGSSPQKRLFTIKAEGTNMLENYNIVDSAGSGNKANTEEFTVNVTDNILNLEFLGQSNGNTTLSDSSKAMISGIQVIGSENTRTLSGELRPWGLTFHNGRGYIGLVADASISQSKDNLYGYIVSFDPEDMSAAFQLELEIPLNYKRERTSYADRSSTWPLRTSVWEPWAKNWEETGIVLSKDTMYVSYPQPVISDIDFDSQGNMIIGIMDRWGHQVGFLNYPAISGNQTYLIGYSAGDIIKAEPTPLRAEGNYTLEMFNSDTIKYFYNDDGPTYNGEFFYNDYFDSDLASHGEIFTGGMGVIPGLDEVVLTVFNPIRTGTNPNFDYDGVYTQGTHVYSTENGDKNRASLFVGQYQYGKASGLGDIEFGILFPGINIGNYVWCDGNGDGIQQANENGIPGVKLYLIRVDEINGNQLVDSTETDEEGLYIFTDLSRNAEYLIALNLNQPGLEGFSRKGSQPFQGSDTRLDSDGQLDLEPGFSIATVQNLDLQYDYSFDFGLLGPESRDVTRTLCLDPEQNSASFNLCEIDTAVKVPGNSVNIVRYYHNEADARLGVNEIEPIEECIYESAGDTLIAKIHLPGDELCYSLSTVILITTDPETNIELTGLACPDQPINFTELIQLNQDDLMVFTDASMNEDSMIQNITNYTPTGFPTTYYFKVSFGDTDCDAFGSITVSTIPPFTIEMEDQASICWGDLFYFSSLNVRFPTTEAPITHLEWSTNGTGTFNSGTAFSNAQSYTPSRQDSARGYVEFYLDASNYCFAERRTVFVNILTESSIRMECLPTDTVLCIDPRINDPYHPEFPEPTALAGCNTAITPVLNFVDIDMDHCDSTSDVASRIIRHWEFNFKDNYTAFCTDTIVVLRLPKLTPDAFISSATDTFYCELQGVPNSGDLLKQYASWKQPLGLHDYELPYSKLRGLTYELPLTIIEAGLQNAADQGIEVYNEYLKSVILRKANGTEITIGDIVSGEYMTDLIAHASPTQLQYGFLQALIERNENPVKIILETFVLNFYPYLLLEQGDWILSEGGHFEQVEEDWFYNGSGHAPYWFSGAWPSIYGNGGCISYCDFGPEHDFNCVLIRIPSWNSETGFDPENCDTICLTTASDLCGISVERELVTDWMGDCPKTRRISTKIIQNCWAATPNGCAGDLTADEVEIVTSYDSTKNQIEIHLSQSQTLIDTLGPVFDFCYSTSWDQEAVQLSIRNGVIGSDALAWERENPTIFHVESNACEAEVYVPDVKVIDNCSGVHSVKAMMDVIGGTRTVALDLTATDLMIMPNGDTCYLLTYSHTSDPIIIPMGGMAGELNEVRYEAADNCWNQSTWSKFIRLEDNVSPTVIANRQMNFSLQSKKGWMNAIDIDEGSWDNCGNILVLARRVDWDEFCVDLCTDALDGVTTLEQLNEIDPLSVLNEGEVEHYYKNQIEWLLDDEACGSDVVDGWIQGIRAYWAENCGPVDEHGNPLIEVPQNFLGGGWSSKIPFGCEDVCKTVDVEILVMDEFCNWSKSWVTVYVEDKIPAKRLVVLEDVTLTCDAYSKYYKPVIDLAVEAGNNTVDPAVFDHLDNLLGGYTIAWENELGQPTDMDGNVFPSEFNVLNTYCDNSTKVVEYQDTLHDGRVVWKTREVPVTALKDETVKYTRGFIGVNCSATITQDIWPDVNECGIGTIMRKFYVTTGCGEEQITREYVQTITIEPTCPLSADMISWPANTQVCLAITYNSSGNVNLPVSQVGRAEYTFPVDCRMMAIGHEDQVLDVPGSNMKKVVRTWSAMDWCTGESLDHQQIIVVTDTCGNADGDILTLSGTIVDPYDNFIQDVTLNLMSNSSVHDQIDIRDGTYFFNVPESPEVFYLDKESSYRNGVSTLDLIWLQKHFKDPTVLQNSYQLIAGDVNNNGLVEPIDMMQIRELILGKRDAFVEVRPWQFIDISTQRAYSKIPSRTKYQENNWIGIKMGDVNFDSDYLIRSTSRSAEEIYPLVIEAADLEGNTTSMAVRMTDQILLAGWQLSLNLSAFDDWRIRPGEVILNEENLNIYDEGINISWNSLDSKQKFETGAVLFYIDIPNTTERIDPNSILLNESFQSEVYTSDLKGRPIGLKYQVGSDEFTFSTYPNPVDRYQLFEFYTPESTRAEITIYSIGGKEMEAFTVDLQRGTSTHQHTLKESYKSGMYVYQIRTADKVLTGRFEVIR